MEKAALSYAVPSFDPVYLLFLWLVLVSHQFIKNGVLLFLRMHFHMVNPCVKVYDVKIISLC